MRAVPLIQIDDNKNWQTILAEAVRDGRELLRLLQLEGSGLAAALGGDKQFPVLVPRPFIALMNKGDEQDPLLRQVLGLQEEELQVPGYVTDPLGELPANVRPGVVHKYHGRVLLIAAGGCAVNCRYCFRRHFPYADNRIGRKKWQEALEYVAGNDSISEVILSGGDPLLLDDVALSGLCKQIADIAHVRRLRIHSRVPVVIPQRITAELVSMLAQTRLQVSLVLHVNHPAEISSQLVRGLDSLRREGITLLNQSVLLQGVNDDPHVLCRLSEALFAAGVLPYYLHRLDHVQGAHHYALAHERIAELYRYMKEHLPGYLLPRLVCEEAGQPHKTVLMV